MERIFLLGGKDLEMEEIKRILINKKEVFYDKNLTWGAKLSSYEEVIRINKDKLIIGIELEKDIKIDFRYLEIDHHNKNINKKSSLEQIAKLLNIELTREQKLIALNDSGYIPAMEKFGASKEEIRKIRFMDRQSQGISEKDEELAEKSILKNKKIYPNLIVVKSFTEKFSTITDRLYPNKNIFIYTDDEFTYYGEKSKELGQKYYEKYGDKIYYGGNENGYFGAGKHQFNLNEIEEILKEVIEYVTRE
jgi:hypothetical protein